MSLKSILVWGAGGHGRVVADAARISGYRVVGFIDNNFERLGCVVDGSGTKVVMSQSDFLKVLDAKAPLPAGANLVAVGIGDNITRLDFVARLGAYCCPPIVHSAASVSDSVNLAIGSVVLAGCIVNDNASIGAGVILNSGSIVEHDCVIGPGCHVSPGAILAGEVTLERLVWVGAGAIILPRLNVGERAIIGAGAVVTSPVPVSTTMVGNPARRL